jgi:hypothetical protein
MSIRRAGVVVAVLMLLGPASAQAARPILVGHGSDPGVAVDARGTAHVAFNAPFESVGPGEPLMYCALARGSRRCTPRPIVADGASPSAQPALVQAGPGSQLGIVSVRGPAVEVVRSLDGGATFGAPASVGSGRYLDGAFGPNGQLALAFRFVGYVEYYQRSLAGPPVAFGPAKLNAGHAVNAEVGFAGARPVLVSGGRRPRIAVSSWTGTGDINDPAAWSGPFKIAPSNYFALAGGRRGLFLAHERPAGTEDRMVVRRFRGRRFGPELRVPGSGTSVIGVGLAQDVRGRLVSAWYSSLDDRIEVSASRTGRRWTRARVLARGVELPGRIEIALGRSGRGVVVWDDWTGDDVFAARVDARRLLRRR